MKKVFFAVFLLISFLIILPFSAYALDMDLDVDEEEGRELTLLIGQVKILPVNNPTRIVIGNPSIADVTEVTKKETTISPKRRGSTTLVIWDDRGEHSYRIRVLEEDLKELKTRIDALLQELNFPQVYTRLLDSEDKIMLMGSVKTPQDREFIYTALGELKDKITDLIKIKEEEAIIEIDVQVLELNNDATETLGFTWPSSITLTDVSGPTTTGTTGLKKVFHLSDFTRSAFNITLDALIQEGKARILSRPRLACLSGKEAELLVGGEKPLFTTQVASAGGQGTEVEYKEFGIKLKIKPNLIAEKRIKLALNVEVSEVGTAETIGPSSAPTAKAFPLSKRTASTELILKDGQTLAIGGLVKQKIEEDIRKTPWLGDIPILGLFFRKSTTKVGGGQGERGDTELFITLTPTIVGGYKEPEATKVIEELEEETVPPVISEDITDPLTRYIKIIQKRVLDKMTYPALAKEAGFEGNVKLSLHLSYQGELMDALVKESSGHKLLDDNAIYIAKSIASYPPFPPSIDSKELWIDIPIVYSLN